MKVILLEDVKSLGKKDTIVDVSDGYARNMLLPKKLAVKADAKAVNDLKLRQEGRERLAAEQLASAKELAEKLKGKKVTLSIKVGAGGRAFGSVSAKEIADAAKDQLGIEIDRKRLVLPSPIKELGPVKVPYRIHPEVPSVLEVEVIEEK